MFLRRYSDRESVSIVLPFLINPHRKNLFQPGETLFVYTVVESRH